MKYLNYIKFKSKLIVLIAFPMLGLVSVLMGLYLASEMTIESIEEFSGDELQIERQIRSLHVLGLQSAQATRNMVVNVTDTLAKRNYFNSKRDFNLICKDLLSRTNLDTSLKRLLVKVYELNTEVNEMNEKAQKMSRSGNLKESMLFLNNSVTPTWRIEKAYIISASALQNKLMNFKKESIVARLNDSIHFYFILSIVAFIFTVFFGFIGVKTINRSIMGIKKAALKIADGNTNFVLPIKGKDEISQLRIAFNQMISNINSTNSALRENNAKMMLAMNVAKMAWWGIDIPTGKIQFDKNKTEMLGYQAENFTNESDFLALVHPKDRQIKLDAYNRHISGITGKYEAEYQILTKLNGYKWVYDIGLITKRNERGEPQQMMGVILDITDRKDSERELKKFLRVIEQNNASIIITNAEGKIEYVNPKFEELTGYVAAEVIGRNPRFLKSGAQSEEFYKQLWDTISIGKTWKGEFLNKKKNGDLFWENSLITPIINTEGEITNFVAIKEDTTEKRKMVDDLIQAKGLAEQSSQLKDSFIANMSHEIRTPLNGILGMTSLIKEFYSNGTSEEEKICFGSIDRSCKRITRTIDLILNYSRIQVGEFVIKPTQMSIFSVCNALHDEFESMARSQSIDFILESKVGEAVVTVDEYSIYQALTHLIDNAIKFTNVGYVKIKINKNENNEIVVLVCDTGIGISKEYLNRIFEPYSQEQIGYTRGYEGVGLGLAYVKRIMEINNVDLSVESIKGKGTTFKLVFKS